MVPLIGKIQRIHHHSDVGAVLAAVTALRYVDQLDGGLVKGSLEFGVAMPVGVGSLDGDLSLLDQPLEDEVNVEIAVSALADTHGHVLKVDKDGNSSFVDLHVGSALVYPSHKPNTMTGIEQGTCDVHKGCPDGVSA